MMLSRLRLLPFLLLLLGWTGLDAAAQTSVLVRDIQDIPQSQIDFLNATGESLTTPDIEANIYNSLLGTLVEIEVVLLSAPYNSGLSALNGSGDPFRVHVFARDINAVTEGNAGMGIQIVDSDYANTGLLSYGIGDVLTIVGTVAPFGTTMQLAPSSITFQGTYTDLSLPASLLDPVVITTDEANMAVGGSGGVQTNWSNLPDLRGQFVRIVGTTVTDRDVTTNPNRPDFYVSSDAGTTVMSFYDTSLRFRNDQDAYPAPFNKREVAEGDFVPPPIHSTVDIQGFLALHSFSDALGRSVPDNGLLSIIPFEDRGCPGAVNFDPLLRCDFDVTATVPITVTSPNGGETWTAGTVETITWDDNLTEDVRIILLKGGAFDRTIVAATPSDGSYDYAIPANLDPGADYAVRIRSVNSAAISDDSDAPFDVPESIVVTSPPPGTMWTAGTTQNITWTSNVTLDVRILLFKGGVFSQTIEVSTPNDGFVFFPIPTTLATGTDYSIRVRLVSNATISDDSDPFEIIAGDVVTVTAPNGGEVWEKGSTQTITWTDNFDANVRIFLFRDGGFFRVITGSTPSDGSFDWTPPVGLPVGSTYTVRVRKGDNYLVRDDSDGNFELTAAMSAPVLVGAANKSGTPGALGTDALDADGVLRWLPVDGAAAYRVEVAADTAFAPVLVAATLEGNTTHFDVRTALEEALLMAGQIEAGRTFAVRVRAEAGPSHSAWAEATLVTDAPDSFLLEGNYPNPFNPTTTIRYALTEATDVRLAVYDVLGREVAVLVEGPQVAGRYQMRFDATSLPSGVYFYRIEAGAFETVRPMLLAK